MKLKLMLTVPLLAFCLGFAACKGTVPVDVVMDGGDVYFVMESPGEIASIRVMPRSPAPGQPALMWELRHDMTVPLDQRKYPSLKQVRYGAGIPELPVSVGPQELGRDAEYVVMIDMGRTFAQETFVITKDNKLVMPDPAFERQKGRVYSAVTDKAGNKEFVCKKADGGKC